MSGGESRKGGPSGEKREKEKKRKESDLSISL